MKTFNKFSGDLIIVGGAIFGGIQGGQLFELVDTDFTLDVPSGKYYTDIEHGYTNVIMELKLDLGAGLILGAPDSVDDSVAGTRTIWVSVLPDSAQVTIVGVA